VNYADLDKARLHHAALTDIFRRHHGGAEDRVMLRQVEDLCRETSDAVDDALCRETLGSVADYAAQMFSDRKHRKWDQNGLPGVEFLRLQILHALDSLLSRISSLETIRRTDDLQARRHRLR
jgi:hypothetical protein